MNKADRERLLAALQSIKGLAGIGVVLIGPGVEVIRRFTGTGVTLYLALSKSGASALPGKKTQSQLAQVGIPGTNLLPTGVIIGGYPSYIATAGGGKPAQQASTEVNDSAKLLELHQQVKQQSMMFEMISNIMKATEESMRNAARNIGG